VLRTAICTLFGIEYPIIQGGMMWIGTAELVSAVSNAGGLGIIGAGNAEPEWVRQQIHLTKQLTSKPFGVNIVMFSPFVDEIIRIVLDERVAVVAFGAGNPERLIPRLKPAGIKVVAVVASVASAKLAQRVGVDAIVAEGIESGGEIGEVATMVLVPQVVDSVQIPVVAAGGIADGRGLAAALALGAQGVQMGTRFVCSQECIAHPGVKERIIQAGDRSTVVTGRNTGYAVRSLENRMSRQFQVMEESGATKEELDWFKQGRTYLGLVEGDVDEGWLLSGQSAGLIKDIKPVKVIIREIVAEAEAIIKTMGERVKHG
jgi:enoyl-[acyl-carrier protein] reductase II